MIVIVIVCVKEEEDEVECNTKIQDDDECCVVVFGDEASFFLFGLRGWFLFRFCNLCFSGGLTSRQFGLFWMVVFCPIIFIHMSSLPFPPVPRRATKKMEGSLVDLVA